MIAVAWSIKTVNTATAIAAIVPALRPLPESPGGPFDGMVVSILKYNRIYFRANQ